MRRSVRATGPGIFNNHMIERGEIFVIDDTVTRVEQPDGSVKDISQFSPKWMEYLDVSSVTIHAPEKKKEKGILKRILGKG